MITVLDHPLLRNARKEGSGWRCLCPAHNDNKPSLSVKVSPTGKLLVHCWSGCKGEDVLRALDLTSTKQLDYPPPDPKMEKTPSWVRKLWDSAMPLTEHDLAARYLLCRGLELEQFPGTLRFLSKCKITGESNVDSLPALLARFDHPNGDFCTVHRTYLTEPGRKAEINSPKRIASSPTKGGAIRLFEPTEKLGIAEGIENAIACCLATNIPTWSVYSASLMPYVVIPPTVREVIIFADNDLSGAGQRAAKQLEDKLQSQPFKVKTILPQEAGKDWLDIYNE